MLVEHLGLMPYRQAWARQEAAHAEVVSGAAERVLIVEHPPVITFGRRPGVDRHLLATPEALLALGVEVVPSDRGGDITFHGPGQLVAYPIVRLADHRLSVGGYVRRLEEIAIATLARFEIKGKKDAAAIGVWADDCGTPAKICALGVRIRKGVSLHGIALNVETNLSYFNLIVPCGLTGRPVTSIRKLLGDRAPDMHRVEAALTEELSSGFPNTLSGTGGRTDIE